MKKGMLILAGVVMALAPVTASAGVVVVGPGFYAPAPFLGAYWGPAYPYGGEVKLDTKVKDAQVFIDGSYAGLTKDNKTIHLRPGTYNIEIREGEQTAFSQQIYVAAGKTIHLTPEL